MENFVINNLDIILTIGGVLLSLMVIKLVTKILFKLIIIIIIITGGFVTYQIFSGTNIIDDINTLYCEGETIDVIKCKCFVMPIMQDLETKYNPEELIALKAKKLRANTEFIKSYKTKETEIKMCFENNDQSLGILDEILGNIKKNGFKILQ